MIRPPRPMRQTVDMCSAVPVALPAVLTVAASAGTGPTQLR